VEPNARKECGYMGIKQPECQSKGCCWRPLENGSKAPWCFFPAAKGKLTSNAFGRIKIYLPRRRLFLRLYTKTFVLKLITNNFLIYFHCRACDSRRVLLAPPVPQVLQELQSLLVLMGKL